MTDMPSCIVPGCDAPMFSGQMCSKHRARRQYRGFRNSDVSPEAIYAVGEGWQRKPYTLRKPRATGDKLGGPYAWQTVRDAIARDLRKNALLRYRAAASMPNAAECQLCVAEAAAIEAAAELVESYTPEDV